MKDLVEFGFMTEEELELHDACDSEYIKYWMPFGWFSHLLAEAYTPCKKSQTQIYVLNEHKLFF